MFIHSVSEQRLALIQSEVYNEENPRDSGDEESVKYNCLPARAARAWLDEYFSEENGRTEKIPNPSAGRDEWNLPCWMTKHAVYRIFLADHTAPTVETGDGDGE